MNRPVLLKLVAGLGLPFAIGFSLLNGLLTSPLGWSVGLIFSALYLVAGVLLFRAGPLWPRAGGWYVAACLAWGAAVCFVLVTLPSAALLSITSKLGWDALEASFGGALPEELAKAFGVLCILYAFRRLGRPWHGFVTGGLIGLGFEINENLLYGATGALIDANSDFEGSVSTWALRTVAGPGLHIALAALSGWGVGQAMFCRGRLAALWWVAVAIAIHFGWNVLAGGEISQFLRIGTLMVVLYGAFGWVYVQAVRWKKSDTTHVLLL